MHVLALMADAPDAMVFGFMHILFKCKRGFPDAALAARFLPAASMCPCIRLEQAALQYWLVCTGLLPAFNHVA